MHQPPASHTRLTPLPSVREVLELPEMRAGNPEIIAGSTGVDREVRWAHVAAGTGVAALLDGGELILTTGAGWPESHDALRTLVDSFVSAGVSAITLELGHDFTEAPQELIDACELSGTPLIVLHHEIRFVQITQRIHQRILAAQTQALEARAEVHAMLTELGLNRSPVDYMIERIAETLDAPVVLEDPAHRVIAWSGRGESPEETLAPWAIADGRIPDIGEGSVRIAVEAQGTRWGTLTALAGEPHPAGRQTVLELGAFALALGRLADRDGDQWLRLSSKRLFEALLEGRYRNDADLTAQLTAAGLPVEGRALLAATLSGTGDFGGHHSLERAILETALRRAVAPEGRVILVPDGDEATLLALVSFPSEDARVSPGSNDEVPPLAHRLARELDMLLPSTTPAAWRAQLSLGSTAFRLRHLVLSLEQARAVGALSGAGRVGRVLVQQAERQPLSYLVRGLAGNPEVQDFALDALGPLLVYDRDHDGDLVRVLEAYTAHPTNRSLAAKRSLLSRSVFYQRLDLIEQLLGVDLTSGEVIATLTVALLARGPEHG